MVRRVGLGGSNAGRAEVRAARGGGDPPPAVGAIWRLFAGIMVALRYPILLGWVVAAVAAVSYLPGISPASAIGNLLPSTAPALRAESDAARLFGVPLAAQAVVVQRSPHGFTRQQQLEAARAAAALDRHQVPPIPGLAGAVPISDYAGMFPGARERSTTIITYLFSEPGTSTTAETGAAQGYARRYLSSAADHLVGVTGAAPAQTAQGEIILRYLPWVELATVLAIGLIVGLYFRSAGAPLATLACAAVAYLVATRADGWAAQRFGFDVPPDLEPVLVVLLLGVTTDYAVFYLSGMRTRLLAGAAKAAAARRTTAEFTPIILTAGLVVALGIGSLAVAPLGPLRSFGPALALTVLTAMVVAITLAPALIAVFGGVLFHLRREAGQAGGTTSANGDSPERAVADRRRRVPAGVRTWRESAARLATSRPVALLVASACIAGLLVSAIGLGKIRLGFPLIQALPSNSQPVQAENAAAKGFAPGILSPTEVLLLGRGVGNQRPALGRLQRALSRRPGVAGVVGPATLPQLQQPAHVMVAASGGAARFGLIEQTNPLGPTAIEHVRALRVDLPPLMKAAGLTGVRFEVGGETALASEAIDSLASGLWRIAAVIALVILMLLAVFLRSLVAPLYLLAASILALLSALGLTVWIFQGLLGYSSLVYYVPFAVAVLLVSLGSDYNVFVVGRIWEEARRRPLREAVAVAVPRASRAITTAGLALAAGFGVLALVPLQQFWEIAVAMIIGITLDTFVVRSLLVPALVVLFGRAGQWPGGRARQPAARGSWRLRRAAADQDRA
jgi:putative drug exporter of the RND superfamily